MGRTRSNQNLVLNVDDILNLVLNVDDILNLVLNVDDILFDSGNQSISTSAAIVEKRKEINYGTGKTDTDVKLAGLILRIVASSWTHSKNSS